ncbi:MAG: acyl-CoA dehydrogenase family protein [Thermoanaerobaculia bacterium]
MESVAQGIFCGRILNDFLYPYPALSDEERETVKFLIESFRKFAKEYIKPEEIEKEKKIPKEVIKGLGEMGILGMTIPEEYGGYGFTTAQYCRVMEEMTRVCNSTAILVGAHQSIGYKGIVIAGSEEQKKKYLPPLATGEKIAAFALTEPEAGSDASSVKTQAKYDPEKKGYFLNGTKQWITNGGIADIVTTLAKTGEDIGLTAFIVNTNSSGFSIGKEEKKLGLKGSSTAQLIYENLFVPEEDVLGRKGRGFLIFMQVLDSGRLGLAASCLGGCKEMIKQATVFANNRKQFGQKIGEFEMIRRKFGKMASYTYGAESMAYLAAGQAGKVLKDFATESALCKFYITEILWEVINDALQVAGGNGYMEEYPFERYLRDSRINLIFEGTNEVTRMYGAQTGLRTVSKFKDFPEKPDEISWACPELKEEAEEVSKLVFEFGIRNRKFLEKAGADLRQYEYELERIANCASSLYACLATLSRTKEEVKQKPEAVLYAKTFLTFEIQRVKNILSYNPSKIDNLCTEVSSDIYKKEEYPFDRWEI